MKYHSSVVGAIASLLLAVAVPVAGDPSPPANDQCPTAIEVTVGSSTSGNNADATSDFSVTGACGDIDTEEEDENGC